MTIGGDREYISIPVMATNNFEGDDKLGRAVTRGGDFADDGLTALGVCLQQVNSGQPMSIGIFGVLKYRPINVVSAGYKLSVTTSGFFQAAAADTYGVGFALGQSSNDDANTSSGALATGFLNFATRDFIDALSGGLLVG